MVKKTETEVVARPTMEKLSSPFGDQASLKIFCVTIENLRPYTLFTM